VIGCGSPIFPPLFKVTEDSIHRELNSVIRSESISFEGHKYRITNPDSLIISLTIQLTNTATLPKDTSRLIMLEKRIAITVRSLLQDPNQFKGLDVFLMYKKQSAVKTETGLIHTHSFKVAEL
jgi:hypothetical protein